MSQLFTTTLQEGRNKDMDFNIVTDENHKPYLLKLFSICISIKVAVFLWMEINIIII